MDIDLALVDEGGFLDPVKESVGAPVPAFVIGYDWAFRPDWVWRNTASAMAMALAINDDDDMEGYASSLSSTVEWRATRYLSVTAGYDFYQLDAEYEGRARCVYATSSAIEEYALEADLVIGAVLIPGAAAPKLVTREQLSIMKPGAVLVDVAIDGRRVDSPNDLIRVIQTAQPNQKVDLNDSRMVKDPHVVRDSNPLPPRLKLGALPMC